MTVICVSIVVLVSGVGIWEEEAGLMERLILRKSSVSVKVERIDVVADEAVLVRRVFAAVLLHLGLLHVLVHSSHFILHVVQLNEHPLHFTVVVFPQIQDFGFELINFLVFLLLTFDEYNRMIEVFFNQVLLVVLAQDFDLTAQVVVRALDQLVLARVFMLLDVLSEYSRSTFIVAVRNLE